MISDNIQNIENKIMAACDRAGRNRDDITLIAVSKTKPVEIIKEVYNNNIYTFGENKVQELRDKYEDIKGEGLDKLKWHMIGHLQRNKVKYIVDKVDLIHSVDSLRLAKQIDKEAKKRDINMDVLIQVNIGDDPKKFGFKPEETEEAIVKISKLEGINIKGLMTMPPYVTNPEENRDYFKKMHQLFVDIDSKNIDNVTMETLSMGMTGDYEVAIEEGATMVRIGTGIFGERNYNK